MFLSLTPLAARIPQAFIRERNMQGLSGQFEHDKTFCSHWLDHRETRIKNNHLRFPSYGKMRGVVAFGCCDSGDRARNGTRARTEAFEVFHALFTHT